jgi:hypothetical protein
VLALAPTASLASWSAPVDLSGLDASSDFYSLASDAQGDLVAFWRHGTVGSNVPQARARPAGGSWGPVTQSTVQGGTVGGTSAAITSAREVLLMWQGQNNGTGLVQWSSGSLESPFGPQQQLTDGSHDATTPELAADEQGNATALWAQSDGTNQIIRTANRPAGGSFSAPQDLSAPGQSSYWWDLAVNEAGDAVSVWSRSDGQNSIIQASVRPAGAAFGPTQSVSLSGANADQSQVAIDRRGDAIAVWVRATGTQKIVQAAWRAPGGQFGAPFDVSAPTADVRVPRVAMDATGNAVLVWLSQTSANGLAQLLESDAAPGQSFAAPIALSDPNKDAQTPVLAVNPSGETIVVWDAEDDSGTSPAFTITAVARPPRGTFSGPHPLSNQGDNGFDPRVVLNADGTGAATWLGHDQHVAAIQEADYKPGGDEPPNPTIGPPASPNPPAVSTPVPTPPRLTIVPRRFAIHGRHTDAIFHFYSPIAHPCGSRSSNSPRRGAAHPAPSAPRAPRHLTAAAKR